MKNYSSISAIVNHRNWLDDSPPLIYNDQKSRYNVHICATRSSFLKIIFSPDLKQKKTQRSIKFQDVSIWNKIDLDTRKLHYKKFCNKYKTILL